jgi:hypothetical protein
MKNFTTFHAHADYKVFSGKMDDWVENRKKVRLLNRCAATGKFIKRLTERATVEAASSSTTQE